jgi:hypothetical protein
MNRDVRNLMRKANLSSFDRMPFGMEYSRMWYLRMLLASSLDDWVVFFSAMFRNFKAVKLDRSQRRMGLQWCCTGNWCAEEKREDD